MSRLGCTLLTDCCCHSCVMERFRAANEQSKPVKPSWRWFPWRAARLMAQVLTDPRGDWRERYTVQDCLDSAMRHLSAWMSGERVDAETGVSHLVCFAVRAAMAAEIELSRGGR
jgi:hypothetical protein